MLTEQQQIDNALDADTRKAFQSLLWPLLGLLLYIGVWCVAQAAVTAEWRVNLVKGTTTVSPASVGATQEAAWAACQARIPKSAPTTATYKCQTPVYVAVVSADPPPPPPPTCAPPQPADLTQPGQCPAGTTGSWTQRKAHTCVGTTWTAAAEWSPATAPAGACVAVPPPPPTTPVLTATVAPNQTNPANSNVTLTWTAVPGTTMYEVYRCTGANCTPSVFLADEPTTRYANNNLPPGFTYRYKVRAWKPDPAGPYSDVITVTTPTSAPPLGTARLEWTKPPTNDDGTALTNLAGYRVLFGLGTAALSQQITVPNAAATQYEVTGLASGTWYFAVRAYATSGAESVSSNVVSKQLP